MLSPDQLRALDDGQRAELLRQLVELQAPADAPTRAQRRFRTTVRTLVTVGAVVLVPWTAYLAATLPRRMVTEHWRGAWVGFDVLLIVALAATAWLGWQRRQLVAIGLVASAVLLLCDAWFDVTLTRGPDRTLSLVTAVLVELPVAVLFARAALNVFRFNADLVWTITGRTGTRPPLYRLPLLGRLAHHDVEA
jgi:hypothetical protein